MLGLQISNNKCTTTTMTPSPNESAQYFYNDGKSEGQTLEIKTHTS